MLYKLKKILSNTNFSLIKDLSIIFLLASIPFPFGVINICFILFCICFIYKYEKFNFNLALIFPIIYYLYIGFLICKNESNNDIIKYLSRMIFIILVPLFFLFNARITLIRRNFILNSYSYLMTLISIFYILRAFYRYESTGNSNYFFYHDLVSLKVNAIYVSLFISLSFINLLLKKGKKSFDFISLVILFVTLILLSSKNIIIISFIGTILCFLFGQKLYFKKKIIFVLIPIIVLALLFTKSKISERFNMEFNNIHENVIMDDGIIKVSLKNAWNQDKFGKQYYFNGSSFRVYQLRLFKEFLYSKNLFWSGLGIRETQNSIKEKQVDYDLNEYYGELNFHNQYIQSFSEFGVIGFLLLIVMIIYSIVKALKNNDIIFIYYSILIISIMLTESLLKTQRGIVFFITFYSIFHSTIYEKIKYIK